MHMVPFLLKDKQFSLIALILHYPNSKMDEFLAQGNSKGFFFQIEQKKHPIEATFFYETDIKSMQSNSKCTLCSCTTSWYEMKIRRS